MSVPQLVPFTRADLQPVGAWLDDPQTRYWLEDRRRSERILRLAAGPPAERRGYRVIGRRAWIIEERDVSVGIVDVEIYDDRTAGLALVVAPAHRDRCVAWRALGAVNDTTRCDGVQEVCGGVETDSVANILCMQGAGFTYTSREPDAEGFVYFARQLSEPAPER